MKNIFSNRISSTSLVLAALFAVAGCSKKPAPPVVTAPPAEAVPVATAVAANPLPAAAAADPVKLFADADAAAKAGAYDKAAQALIAAQSQKNLTEQQAAAAQQRMVSLQRGLADAISRGDASAKAAADLIRQAHTVH